MNASRLASELAVEILVAILGAAMIAHGAKSKHAAELAGARATNDSTFWCRIVRESDGTPIEGAIVRPCAEAGQNWTLASDAKGLVHFEVQRSEEFQRIPIEIDAPGCAPRFVLATENHASEATAREVRVLGRASLVVTVLKLGAPLAGASVEVVAKRRDLIATGPNEVVGVLARADVELTTIALTDVNGRCSFENVAPNVPLAVRARRDAPGAAPEETTARLPAGETRSVVLEVESRVPLSGRMLDQFEMPVAGASVRLYGADASDRYTNTVRASASDLEDHFEPVCVVTTDARGRFRFDSVLPGAHWIATATADGSAPIAPELRIASATKLVEVPRTGSPVESELDISRGLYISGRVLGVDDKPVFDVRVYAWSRIVDSPSETRTDAAGRFAIGPCCVGTYTLECTPRRTVEHFIEPDSIQVTAGTSDATFRLELGTAVSGNVVDRDSREPLSAGVYAVRSESQSPRGSYYFDDDIRERLDGLTLYRLDGVRPGTYTLIARTHDGRVAFKPDITLELDHELQLPMEVERGAVLQLNLGSRDTFVIYELLRDGRRLDRDEVIAHVPIYPLLVPPGEWTVKLYDDKRALIGERHASVAARDVVTLDFATGH